MMAVISFMGAFRTRGTTPRYRVRALSSKRSRWAITRGALESGAKLAGEGCKTGRKTRAATLLPLGLTAKVCLTASIRMTPDSMGQIHAPICSKPSAQRAIQAMGGV
jgi:hypothetical protein